MPKRPGWVTLQTRAPLSVHQQLAVRAEEAERSVSAEVKLMLRGDPPAELTFETPRSARDPEWLRVNVELLPEQAEAIRVAAEKSGVSVASWIYAVIRRKLQD